MPTRRILLLSIASFCICSIDNEAFALCALGFGDCEQAQSSEAIEKLGLLGIWSYDCADEKQYRFTFSASPPTRKISVSTDAGLSVAIENITNATLVTADKIKLVANQPTNTADGPISDTFVYVKENGKVRLLEWIRGYRGSSNTLVHEGIQYAPGVPGTPNRSTGVATPMIEKCLN